MNTNSIVVVPARGRKPSRWAEGIVTRALGAMNEGNLRLELPSGCSRVFGYEGASAGAQELSAVIRVHRESFFRRCLLYGDIGFAESYMAGEWDTDDLVAVIRWFIANIDQAPTLSGSSRRAPVFNVLRLVNRLAHLVRPNSRRVSRRNIKEHYDLSNQFFGTFLDSGMTYSSAIWGDAEISLEAAQEAKYERLCRKLRLTEEDEVLEIGCGWGGFALYAAANYGCRVTGLTLSPAQHQLGCRRVEEAGLGSQVSLRLEDYREHRGEYSKLVSIEMLEAVGHKYLPDFARACGRFLRPDGLMALQFIVCPDSRYTEFRRGVDFIQKHIFPGSLLISMNRLNGLLSDEGDFWLHNLRDLGLDYARTLREWAMRFGDNLDVIRDQGFDERFIRKWKYYFSYCEAAFAARNISVVQAVYTRPNNRLLAEYGPLEGSGLFREGQR